MHLEPVEIEEIGALLAASKGGLRLSVKYGHYLKVGDCLICVQQENMHRSSQASLTLIAPMSVKILRIPKEVLSSPYRRVQASKKGGSDV